MSANSQIIKIPPTDGKIGPIKTAQLREPVGFDKIKPLKIHKNESIDMIPGYRGILVHDNNFDIFNPFIQ